MSIIEAEVTTRLDAAGSWRVRLPLTDSRTAEATVGRYWLQFREGEGFVFGGIIENIQKQPEDMLQLSGPTLIGELVYKNTLLNRQYTGTLNAAIDGLLALASGWTRNGSNTTTIDARFDGESVLKALLLLIDQPRIHLRELITEAGGILTKKVDIGAFGASSGVILMGGNPDAVVLDDPALAYVEHISVEETVEEVWNWLIPLGAGDGKTQLTLEFSTRTTPYTIQTVAGPDSATIYYLSDAGSITTYGQRERAFVAKDVAPLSNTKAALQAAANALYDLAVRQLQWWKDKQTAYRLTVRGLKPGVKPGDKVRLRWRGYAEHWDTGYAYLDINTELYVLERTRHFLDDGTETSSLIVSDIDRQLQTSTEVVIGKLEDTARAFRTRVQTSVSNWTAGPVLGNVDATHPLDFDIYLANNVTQLLRAEIRIKPRAIQSTTTGAAAGGTSPSDGPSSASTTGPSNNTTTSPSSANTTGPSNNTTTSYAAHRHEIGLLGISSGQHDPSTSNRAWNVYDSGGNFLTSVFVGSGVDGSERTIYTKSADAAHTHDMQSHIHPMSHTHDMQSHTHPMSHTHTLAVHTHGQTYAIFEGGSAAGMTITIKGVDRTAALGGPWAAAATLDITQYLQDADGVVVLGITAISLGSTQLGRIEAWVDLTAVVQAIVAT